MAYSFPSTISTGDVLTASTWNQAIRENQKFGMATFTNEAARDAAITSPEEGMRAYLTAPTVPAATGTAILPTGITTVYNGSAWVCTTDVGAYVATSQNTTSTAYTDLATAGPAVTLSTGTTALVTLSAALIAGATGAYSIASFAVSGATTRAANDVEGVFLQSTSGTQQVAASRVFLVTGLTAGTNTFTTKYRVTAGTGSFEARLITVRGVA